MVYTDYSDIQNLILAYPDRFYNEYDILISFYDSLIDLIPNNIQLWLVANNKATCEKLESKYQYKRVNTIGIKNWDEIRIRDCIGINMKETVIKPLYIPHYCMHYRQRDYFEHLNKQSRILIRECLQKKISHLPLVMNSDGFLYNSTTLFLGDKVLGFNSELSESEIIKILQDYTSLRPEIVEVNKNNMPRYTDGLARFLSEKSVLLSNKPSLPFLKADIDFTNEVRQKLIDGKFEIIDFYERPIDEVVRCGCCGKNKKACLYSLRGSYTTFLRLNDTIILPEYTLPSMKESSFYNTQNAALLKQLGFNVKTVNCDQLSKLGASLHSISYTF